MSRFAALDSCQRCELACPDREGVAHPEGNFKADVVLVVRSPERSGDILSAQHRKVLQYIGVRLKRDIGSFYLTALVKCFDPESSVEAVHYCKHEWLYREIARLRPVIVVGFGGDVCRELHPRLWELGGLISTLPYWHSTPKGGYQTVDMVPLADLSEFNRDIKSDFWVRVDNFGRNLARRGL